MTQQVIYADRTKARLYVERVSSRYCRDLVRRLRPNDDNFLSHHQLRLHIVVRTRSFS